MLKQNKTIIQKIMFMCELYLVVCVKWCVIQKTYQTQGTELGGQGGHGSRLATHNPDEDCTKKNYIDNCTTSF